MGFSRRYLFVPEHVECEDVQKFEIQRISVNVFGSLSSNFVFFGGGILLLNFGVL